jgi:hypothetical protein
MERLIETCETVAGETKKRNGNYPTLELGFTRKGYICVKLDWG